MNCFEINRSFMELIVNKNEYTTKTILTTNVFFGY